jgi:ribosome-associated heat shock protein Hsp15
MNDSNKVRLDKWLWAARFFKTRSLASDAIQGGKVHVNGQRVKPSKEAHVGQTLSVRTGWTERTVIIQALSTRRGPATEAQKLYAETPDSIARREAEDAQRKVERAQSTAPTTKPNKKDRRLIHRFKRRDS